MRLNACESSSNSSPVSIWLRIVSRPAAIASETSRRCFTGFTITYLTMMYDESIATIAVMSAAVISIARFRLIAVIVCFIGSVTATAPARSPTFVGIQCSPSGAGASGGCRSVRRRPSRPCRGSSSDTSTRSRPPGCTDIRSSRTCIDAYHLGRPGSFATAVLASRIAIRLALEKVQDRVALEFVKPVLALFLELERVDHLRFVVRQVFLERLEAIRRSLRESDRKFEFPSSLTCKCLEGLGHDQPGHLSRLVRAPGSRSSGRTRKSCPTPAREFPTRR